MIFTLKKAMTVLISSRMEVNRFVLAAISFLIALFGFPAQASQCLVYLSKINPMRTIELTAYRDGTVGKMLYTHIDGDAYIGAILVDHSSRRSGVSRDLIQHMIEREEPTRSISAVLILDNYKAAELSELDRDATFEECADAVKKTPLYKVSALFGFTTVLQCVHTIRAEMISVSFGRDGELL